ncbi:sensor histidine kinase [Cellulomonas sp. PhB150]|uniref:sensor histidine kinase n=1 Tax=Cellulomonas sp. PhB150 TaxID=2485188 RepID=UPI0013155510|nr:histidine kinase [Cellulomonas sp. PhB150]
MGPGAALLTLTLAAWAPLLIQTYRPVLALAGTVLADACIITFLSVPPSVAELSIGMGARQPAPIATVIAAYTLASRVPLRFGWIAGTSAGAILFVVSVLTGPSEFLLADLVMFYLVLTGTGIGSLVTVRRERARRLEVSRAELTDRAVLDERLRIARELHDVLAHNLTLVNAQAGVAEYLLRTDPDAAATALQDITNHTTRAIEDLQATIGLLRHDDGTTAGARAPTPGLARLDDLVGSFRSAGTTVDLTTDGVPWPLSEIADLAAYRIVQESLTNATKHAPGVTILVGVRWSATVLELMVTNSLLRTDARPPAPGTGHGLIGMRERASAAGGTLVATAIPGPSFQVHATLPRDVARGDGSDAEGSSS